jgi:hypothetical protein
MAMTNHDESDMNSHEARNVKASSASTTRFMPARNAVRGVVHLRAGQNRARTGLRRQSRKNADSASIWKCAPSHGSLSGSVTIKDVGAPAIR